MSERNAGWYWVQVSSLISREWEAAKYSGGKWFMAGMSDSLPDGIIHTVGPRISTPDEAWQAVPIHPDKVMNAAGREYTHAVAHMWADMLAAAPKP